VPRRVLAGTWIIESIAGLSIMRFLGGVRFACMRENSLFDSRFG